MLAAKAALAEAEVEGSSGGGLVTATVNGQSELVKLVIDPAAIDPLKPLSEFGLDSLALAELMFNIEDHFHIDYPESRTGVLYPHNETVKLMRQAWLEGHKAAKEQK